MIITIEIPKAIQGRLEAKACAAGLDISAYAMRVLERDLLPYSPSIIEISGKVADDFKKTGTTEEELWDLLEAEKHAMRAQKRGKPFSE